jgi:adenylyltransferase/sulfurtransferase
MGMANPVGAPEITVREVEQKRQAGEDFVWLDVREPNEQQLAYIEDPRVVEAPTSRIAAFQAAALPEEAQDKDVEIIVFCHHGMRSAQVAAWLIDQGWANVYSMTGGIDAWAEEIDESVGMY